jgi:biopolymer transport protein ExbD
MADLGINSNGGMKSQRKRRVQRHSTHIDMTPMVDLMSLLITFFMLTTAFAKPKIMEIVLPQTDTGSTSQQPIPSVRTLNLLLAGDNKLYYYLGKPPDSDTELEHFATRLLKTTYGNWGIRKILLQKNMLLYEKIDSIYKETISGKMNVDQDTLQSLIRLYKKKDKQGPIVLIKAHKSAKYRNIVDVIDEMAICNVARYAVVDMNSYEQKMLETAPK